MLIKILEKHWFWVTFDEKSYPSELKFAKKLVFHPIRIHLKEHLCGLSSMLPLVYHRIHSVWISSIQRIFKRFLICKQIWTYCTQQKSLECMVAILKETLNLQMKNVIFQKARNWKQHASLFQYSRVASKVMVLHSKRS